MTTVRFPISDFQLANPLYTAAQVTFFTVDASGHATATLATLYADPVSSTTAANPQTLDGTGKFSAPVYIATPVIASVVGPNVGSHVTGVIDARGTWKGNWAAATAFFSNDFLSDPGTGNIYVAAKDYTSSSSLASDISAGNLILVISKPSFLGNTAQGVFDIRAYGALTSNSSAANDTAINAAIAAAIANVGGDVLVPVGTFNCSSLSMAAASNVRLVGLGKGSILNFTTAGSGVGLTVSNAQALSVENLQLASSSATMTLMQASAINVGVQGLYIDRVVFQGGGRGLQLTSTTGVGGGVFSARITRNVFNSQSIISLDSAPLGFGLVQAISVINNEFYGYLQALRHTNGSGFLVLGNRFERNVGGAVTTPDIHVDTTAQFEIDSNYFETDANAVCIEAGTSVSNLMVASNLFGINNSGSTHTGAGALKVTDGTCKGVCILNNRVSVTGTVGNVWDTNTAPVFGRGNGFDSGTAAWGFASTATAANVDIDDTFQGNTPTTFTSGTQQVGVGRMASDFANATGSVAAARLPSFGSGDVSFASGGGAGTIAANAVTNAKAAQMAASTIKGNNTGSTANAADLTVAQAQALLELGLISFTASVNFNAGNTDTSIPITLPTGFTRYRIVFVAISGASQTLTTATAGLFTAAAGAGTAIVTAASAITVSTASENTNNNMQEMAVNSGTTTSFTAANLFWRVATAQGVAATGTVTITIKSVS